VRKIVDTLLSNAVRFTPAGQGAGVRLTRAGGGLSLTVWDNGVGMDAADLSRLGEPFQRTGPAPVSEAPGLGISLAITRHLVALHGGTLEFQSTVGIGTTVRVTLPVAQPGVDPNLS
jgi:signal transduction histidine kinase